MNRRKRDQLVALYNNDEVTVKRAKDAVRFAARTWSRAPRAVALVDKRRDTDVTRSDPAALEVFSTKDLVIDCLLPYLAEFEDILALSRLCIRTRAILQKWANDFIAFRLMTAPFGRSHSISEWHTREVTTVGQLGAVRMYYYLLQRYSAGSGLESSGHPVHDIGRVLLAALDTGTRMSRVAAFSFCERIVGRYLRCPTFTCDAHTEKGKLRALLPFLWEGDSHRSGKDKGDTAIELHKRVFFSPAFVEPAYLLKYAIRKGVGVDVFAYFVANYHAYLASLHHLTIPPVEFEFHILSHVVRTSNPELVTYVLDYMARLYPKFSTRKYMERIFAEGRENKFAVLPATLDILRDRGIIYNHLSYIPEILGLHHRLYNRKMFFRANDNLAAHRAICAEYEWWDTWIKSSMEMAGAITLSK